MPTREDIIDYLKKWWRDYRAPIIVLLLNFVIYDAFGVPLTCSRCPVPPMNTFEKILFTITYLIDFIVIVWIFLIHAIRQKERERF